MGKARNVIEHPVHEEKYSMKKGSQPGSVT